MKRLLTVLVILLVLASTLFIPVTVIASKAIQNIPVAVGQGGEEQCLSGQIVEEYTGVETYGITFPTHPNFPRDQDYAYFVAKDGTTLKVYKYIGQGAFQLVETVDISSDDSDGYSTVVDALYYKGHVYYVLKDGSGHRRIYMDRKLLIDTITLAGVQGGVIAVTKKYVVILLEDTTSTPHKGLVKLYDRNTGNYVKDLVAPHYYGNLFVTSDGERAYFTYIEWTHHWGAKNDLDYGEVNIIKEDATLETLPSITINSTTFYPIRYDRLEAFEAILYNRQGDRDLRMKIIIDGIEKGIYSVASKYSKYSLLINEARDFPIVTWAIGCGFLIATPSGWGSMDSLTSKISLLFYDGNELYHKASSVVGMWVAYTCSSYSEDVWGLGYVLIYGVCTAFPNTGLWFFHFPPYGSKAINNAITYPTDHAISHFRYGYVGLAKNSAGSELAVLRIGGGLEAKKPRPKLVLDGEKRFTSFAEAGPGIEGGVVVDVSGIGGNTSIKSARLCITGARSEELPGDIYKFPGDPLLFEQYGVASGFLFWGSRVAVNKWSVAFDKDEGKLYGDGEFVWKKTFGGEPASAVVGGVYNLFLKSPVEKQYFTRINMTVSQSYDSKFIAENFPDIVSLSGMFGFDLGAMVGGYAVGKIVVSLKVASPGPEDIGFDAEIQDLINVLFDNPEGSGLIDALSQDLASVSGSGDIFWVAVPATSSLIAEKIKRHLEEKTGVGGWKVDVEAWAQVGLWGAVGAGVGLAGGALGHAIIPFATYAVLTGYTRLNSQVVYASSLVPMMLVEKDGKRYAVVWGVVPDVSGFHGIIQLHDFSYRNYFEAFVSQYVKERFGEDVTVKFLVEYSPNAPVVRKENYNFDIKSKLDGVFGSTSNYKIIGMYLVSTYYMSGPTPIYAESFFGRGEPKFKLTIDEDFGSIFVKGTPKALSNINLEKIKNLISFVRIEGGVKDSSGKISIIDSTYIPQQSLSITSDGICFNYTPSVSNINVVKLAVDMPLHMVLSVIGDVVISSSYNFKVSKQVVDGEEILYSMTAKVKPTSEAGSIKLSDIRMEEMPTEDILSIVRLEGEGISSLDIPLNFKIDPEIFKYNSFVFGTTVLRYYSLKNPKDNNVVKFYGKPYIEGGDSKTFIVYFRGQDSINRSLLPDKLKDMPENDVGVALEFWVNDTSSLPDKLEAYLANTGEKQFVAVNVTYGFVNGQHIPLFEWSGYIEENNVTEWQIDIHGIIVKALEWALGNGTGSSIPVYFYMKLVNNTGSNIDPSNDEDMVTYMATYQTANALLGGSGELDIHVRYLDTSGELHNLQNAEVYVVDIAGTTYHGFTDTVGWFNITSLPSGTAYVNASHPSYGFAEEEVYIHKSTKNIAELTLYESGITPVPPPGGSNSSNPPVQLPNGTILYPVEVRVLFNDSAPVPGALIFVNDTFVGVTDSNGWLLAGYYQRYVFLNVTYVYSDGIDTYTGQRLFNLSLPLTVVFVVDKSSQYYTPEVVVEYADFVYGQGSIPGIYMVYAFVWTNKPQEISSLLEVWNSTHNLYDTGTVSRNLTEGSNLVYRLVNMTEPGYFYVNATLTSYSSDYDTTNNNYTGPMRFFFYPIEVAVYVTLNVEDWGGVEGFLYPGKTVIRASPIIIASDNVTLPYNLTVNLVSYYHDMKDDVDHEVSGVFNVSELSTKMTLIGNLTDRIGYIRYNYYHVWISNKTRVPGDSMIGNDETRSLDIGPHIILFNVTMPEKMNAGEKYIIEVTLWNNLVGDDEDKLLGVELSVWDFDKKLYRKRIQLRPGKLRTYNVELVTPRNDYVLFLGLFDIRQPQQVHNMTITVVGYDEYTADNTFSKTVEVIEGDYMMLLLIIFVAIALAIIVIAFIILLMKKAIGASVKTSKLIDNEWVEPV